MKQNLHSGFPIAPNRQSIRKTPFANQSDNGAICENDVIFKLFLTFFVLKKYSFKIAGPLQLVKLLSWLCNVVTVFTYFRGSLSTSGKHFKHELVSQRLSPTEWDQIGIELGAKHVIYQKLTNFRKRISMLTNMNVSYLACKFFIL